MNLPLGLWCRTVLVGALLVSGCGKGRTVTVTVDSTEIQQRIATKFPVELEQLFTRVKLSEPQVSLKDGSDRVAVELRVNVKAPLLPERTGRVGVNGKVAYRVGEKAFYLKDPRLEHLELDGVEPQQMEILRPLIESVARPALENHPVYQLAGRDVEEVSAEYLLRDVAVRNGKLYATLGLSRSP